MNDSAIPGVRFHRLQRHEDARGAFREIWRASAFADFDAGAFVQANLSSSATGVLRGLHVHRHQVDYWTVVLGVTFVALVDLRPALEGSGARPVVETRTLGRDETVLIPAGVAHGFLALEPVELLYLVTNEYDGTDELGFAWDDAAVGVAWPAVETPDGRPILSERDRSSPTLVEVLGRLRA